jgi:hypothetical protein
VPALDQPLREADRGHGLAFAAGRGGNRGDEHELAAALRETVEHFEADFRGVPSVRLEQVFRDSQPFGDGADWVHKR